MRKRNLVRAALAIAAGVTAVTFVAVSADASVYESSSQYASYSTGGYTLYNDEWGNGHNTETLWVNSPSNWGVYSTQPNTGGIKAYPNVSKDVGTPLDSLNSATSSFSQSLPGAGNFESAYDIWLNGHSYEIMIWTHTQNVSPIGAPTDHNVQLGGQSWTLWAGSNGSNATYSFVLDGNEDSGTVDILAMLKYLENTKHYFSNPTVSTIQYGFEVTSTNNAQENFAVNSYSVSTGGSSNGTGQPQHQPSPQQGQQPSPQPGQQPQPSTSPQPGKQQPEPNPQPGHHQPQTSTQPRKQQPQTSPQPAYAWPGSFGTTQDPSQHPAGGQHDHHEPWPPHY